MNKDENTGAFFSGVQKPAEGFYNLRVNMGIWGCALSPLEASALSGKTPAPNGKVR